MIPIAFSLYSCKKVYYYAHLGKRDARKKYMGLKITDGNSKDFTRPLSGDIRADFEGFLAANGMTVDPKKGLVVGGDIGRAYMEVGGRQKLVGWYQVWLDQEVPFGRCGDRTVSNDEPIASWKPENASSHKMTDEQREQIRLLSEQAAKDREERQAQAAKRARELWDSYPEATDDNPYLKRKGVTNHGLRQDGDRLVIPVLDAKLKVAGLQYIDDTGGKKFLQGTKKKGSFFVIDPESMRQAHTINYVEGYATGASYFADLGQPVVVCFDAFNLSPVAETISGYFPQAKHVFIADFDDSKTGEQEAIKAAQVVQRIGAQAEVLMPQSKGDYNDHAIEGELMPELNHIEVPAEVEWSKSEKGRLLNVKENVRAVS
jgi:putative DNA primase/helicase